MSKLPFTFHFQHFTVGWSLSALHCTILAIHKYCVVLRILIFLWNSDFWCNVNEILWVLKRVLPSSKPTKFHHNCNKTHHFTRKPKFSIQHFCISRMVHYWTSDFLKTTFCLLFAGAKGLFVSSLDCDVHSFARIQNSDFHKVTKQHFTFHQKCQWEVKTTEKQYQFLHQLWCSSNLLFSDLLLTTLSFGEIQWPHLAWFGWNMAPFLHPLSLSPSLSLCYRSFSLCDHFLSLSSLSLPLCCQAHCNCHLSDFTVYLTTLYLLLFLISGYNSFCVYLITIIVISIFF